MYEIKDPLISFIWYSLLENFYTFDIENQDYNPLFQPKCFISRRSKTSLITFKIEKILKGKSSINLFYSTQNVKT